MNKKIHIYKQRHIFSGDELIGHYEVRRRTFTLLPGQEDCHTAVRAHFIRAHGILARLVSADGSPVPPQQPMSEFPAEVLALKDPLLGDLSPALVAHAREHFPQEEFDLRYGGRVDPPAGGLPAAATVSSAPVAAPEPARKRAVAKKAAGKRPAARSDG